MRPSCAYALRLRLAGLRQLCMRLFSSLLAVQHTRRYAVGFVSDIPCGILMLCCVTARITSQNTCMGRPYAPRCKRATLLLLPSSARFGSRRMDGLLLNFFYADVALSLPAFGSSYRPPAYAALYRLVCVATRLAAAAIAPVAVPVTKLLMTYNACAYNAESTFAPAPHLHIATHIRAGWTGLFVVEL